MAAKTTPKKKQKPTEWCWDYSLAALPSAQHRAGLAGLICMMRWLNKEHGESDERKITAIDQQGASVRFTEAGLIELMDAFYDVAHEESATEQERKTKVGDPDPSLIRIEKRQIVDRKKKITEKVFYIYPKVRPAGAFLVEWAPRGDEGRWMRLWRDMIFSIMRGIEAQKNPYKSRAAGKTSGEGQRIWKALMNIRGAEGIKQASTFYLGAQEKSAEGVFFMDKKSEQFLLTFWPLMAQIYIPAVMRRQQGGDWREEFAGSYAIAVPDVCRLLAFIARYEQYMRGRAVEGRGYRPAQAAVDLPAEAGLAFLRALGGMVAEEATPQEDNVLGIEVIHAEKDSHNVVIKGLTRVEPGGGLLGGYVRIKAGFWDLQVRRLLIENLIDGRAWIRGFGRLMSVQDTELTIARVSFQHDARILHKQSQEDPMGEVSEDLKKTVWWIVKNWLHARVIKRDTDLKVYDDRHQVKTKDQQHYDELSAKAAMEAFYAVRSRTGRDFADYFTTTLCAVPQSMGTDRYMELSAKLLDDAGCEDVRALTLLALSALGRPFRKQEQQESNSGHDNQEISNDEE